MKPTLCKHCHRPVTWEDQKYAFNNLLINKYAAEVLKPIFPSHLKCAKKHIKDNKIAKIAQIKNN